MSFFFFDVVQKFILYEIPPGDGDGCVCVCVGRGGGEGGRGGGVYGRPKV